MVDADVLFIRQRDWFELVNQSLFARDAAAFSPHIQRKFRLFSYVWRQFRARSAQSVDRTAVVVYVRTGFQWAVVLLRNEHSVELKSDLGRLLAAKVTMATSGELIGIVAGALDLPAETVGVHVRNLRLTNLISKRGVGRSAATMGPGDAAILILAALGSVQSRDSAASVQAFGQLKPWPEPPTEASHQEPGMAYPFPGPNLEVTLTRELWRLRKSYMDDELSRVYGDDFVGNAEWLGMPALHLMACGTEFARRRVAVVRRFFPGHAEQASFTEVGREIYGEQQFYVAAGFPSVIQARYVSPRALRQIAWQLR